VPPFDLCQSVFEEVPWAAAEERLLATLELGYSTSLFLSWAGERIEQVWVKAPERLAGLEGRPVVEAPRHPIPGADPVHCTVQGDVPGPAHERLPHFRLEGIPSAGAELQSEYAVAREDAAACVRALRAVGGEIAPVLHISEIRAVAGDDYWLSPFYGRDSVTFHFTWKAVPEAERAIAAVEGALAPWSPRPHWAKLFALDMAAVRGLYPCADTFVALRERLDPGGTFRNPFVDRLVAGAA
jgi:xylitol oxidase